MSSLLYSIKFKNIDEKSDFYSAIINLSDINISVDQEK